MTPTLHLVNDKKFMRISLMKFQCHCFWWMMIICRSKLSKFIWVKWDVIQLNWIIFLIYFCCMLKYVWYFTNWIIGTDKNDNKWFLKSLQWRQKTFLLLSCEDVSNWFSSTLYLWFYYEFLIISVFTKSTRKLITKWPWP